MKNKIKKSLANIKLVITDIDGVLTDGSLFYNETGEFFKQFNARDGLGVTLLRSAGIQVAALSGRDSPALRKRLADLNIKTFILGNLDKKYACNKLIELANVSPEETLYIGDDSVDLPAFEICGVSCTVADAEYYIKEQATFTLTRKGGHTAFRELADMLLIAQGKEDSINTAQGFLASVKKLSQ